MFDLSGKTALVTGASGGIGGAIAKALHAQGAVVGLSGTREDALAELAGDLGERAHVLPANLSEPEAPAVLVENALAAMGSVDILVNNAGLTRDGLAVRMSDQDWQSVMHVNMGAAFRLTRNCLKGMMKSRWGRVISVSSVVGVTGNAGQANYAASKAALIGMSKSIAQEVASRGITLNCIAPGFIQTAMTDALPEKQQESLLASIPSGRLGSVEDIAVAAVYLASEEAAYVTGQTLHVNGGMVMI